MHCLLKHSVLGEISALEVLIMDSHNEEAVSKA